MFGVILMKSIFTLAAVCTLAACSAAASNEVASQGRQMTREEEDIAAAEEAVDNAFKAADNASGSDASDAAATPKPKPVRMASGPSLNTTAYCQKIGDTAGGSYLIKLACRDMENKARLGIASSIVSARTHSYCTEIGETAGGSYQIYKACVEQESEAASSL